MARLILTIIAAASAISAANITVQYATVPKDEIERRLRSIETSNIKREQVLLKLFETSGCIGEHLGEQPVKNAKAPHLYAARRDGFQHHCRRAFRFRRSRPRRRRQLERKRAVAQSLPEPG